MAHETGNMLIKQKPFLKYMLIFYCINLFCHCFKNNDFFWNLKVYFLIKILKEYDSL
jgi:hypothetical protein